MQNQMHEMGKVLDNDQNKFSEIIQRVGNLEARPPSIILQNTSESTTTTPVVAELNKVLQDMQQGLKIWQNQVEKSLEDKNNAVLAKFEQLKVDCVQRQQGLEHIVLTLRQEVIGYLQSTNQQRQVDLAHFSEDVGKAFRSMLQKISRPGANLALRAVHVMPPTCSSSSYPDAKTGAPLVPASLPTGAERAAPTKKGMVRPEGTATPQGPSVQSSQPLPCLDKSRRAVGKTNFFVAAPSVPPPHAPLHTTSQISKKRKFVRHPSPPWGQWMPQISMLFHNKFCPWFWARVQKNFQAKEVIGLSGNANFCVFLKKCKK